MEVIVPRYFDFISENDDSWQERGEHYKVGAGILPICSRTGRMLLFMRTYVPGDADAGKWATAGGMLDDKELAKNIDVGAREGALREFGEETGRKDPFDRLIASYVYVSEDGSFKYHNFIGLVAEEFDPKLNQEHEDFKWFSVADLKLVPRELFHFGLKLLFANDQKTITEYAK